MKTINRMRTQAGIALVSAVLAAAAFCCSTSGSKKPNPSEPDSGGNCDGSCAGSDGGFGGSGGSGGQSSTGGQGGSGGAECKPLPLTATVPEGWEEFTTADCKLRLYVPSSKEYLPPPLVWEPCTSKSGPLSYDCRQLKVDWPTEEPPPYSLGGDQRAYVDSNGKVIIQVRKVYRLPGAELPTAYMGLVVEADGPVRQAFWRDYAPRQSRQTQLGDTNIAPGKSGWYMSEISPSGYTDRRAPFAGDDTLLRPTILFDRMYSDPDCGTVWVGPDFYTLVTKSKLSVRKWDGTDMGIAAYGPSAHTIPQWIGRTMLFSYEVWPYYELLRWTEQDGTQVLVGFGDDDSRGAAYPGSDGIDLVWIQGEDRGPTEHDFSKRWIMTSKFSTNPAEIKPRRLIPWGLRFIGATSGDIPPPVGCGYAVYEGEGGDLYPGQAGLIIVRLSDGVSWLVPSVSGVPPDGWSAPIAITCDEVFSRYKGGYLETIRRVRLDSLGPGTPPPK